MKVLKEWIDKLATQYVVDRLRTAFAGKKRWLTALAYSVAIAGTLAGVPVENLLGELVGDPTVDKKETVAALVAAAVAQFRFFQNMGVNRDLKQKVKSLEEKSNDS